MKSDATPEEIELVNQLSNLYTECQPTRAQILMLVADATIRFKLTRHEILAAILRIKPRRPYVKRTR